MTDLKDNPHIEWRDPDDLGDILDGAKIRGLAHTTGHCKKCQRFLEGDLVAGFCFDCAHLGESEAARRTVLQHLRKSLSGSWRTRPRWERWHDLTWAWQRLTRTGDYSKGGTFDWEGYDWR